MKKQPDFEITRFYYLYWFCVGVFLLSFAAMMALLFLEIPTNNREMAANAQGFLQGSLIMSAVGFLLTGSIMNNKKKDPGTVTIEPSDPPVSTTITTEAAKTDTETSKSDTNG